MGSAGMRFGRNVPLSETFPDTANLMTPNPRRVSLELLDPHDLPAGHDPQRDRRGVDPVHGARLVRAQEGHLDAHARHPGGRWRRLARAADARAEDTGGSAKGCRVDEAASLHQREHPLVGRLAGVWQHPRQPDVSPRRTGRQSARQPQRAARRGSGHRPRDHRLHRERLGRSESASRAVRARAQRHLRSAQAAQHEVG